MSLRKAYRFYLYVSFLTVLGGCSLILTRKQEPTFEHTVRFKGETTYLVSSWYTGNTKNSKTIKRINHLKNSQLQVGQEVLIPRRLLIRKTLLPKSFLDTSSASKKRTPSSRNANVEREIAKVELPTNDSTDVVRSSLVKRKKSDSGVMLGEPKPNDWVGEEFERDSIQERILKTQN